MEHKEMVNHPSHYQSNGIEAIDAIRAGIGTKGTMDFCHGNALKYLLRANKKGHYLEDIKKAAWYLNYIIKEFEENTQEEQTDDHVYFQ